MAPDSEEVARRIFETNFFAVLRMSQAFAPVLKANGGGALLNVLSVASWVNGGELAAYSASKSAAWSLTNALRSELAGQKTQRSEEHTSELQSPCNLVCRLLLEKKKTERTSHRRAQ